MSFSSRVPTGAGGEEQYRQVGRGVHDMIMGSSGRRRRTEVQVRLLLGVRSRRPEQGREALRLLGEPRDVGQAGERLEGQSPVGEGDLAQAATLTCTVPSSLARR